MLDVTLILKPKQRLALLLNLLLGESAKIIG